MNRKHRSVMIQGILASVRFHPFSSACMILSIIGCIVAGLIPPLLMEQIINRILDGNMDVMGLCILWICISAVNCILEVCREGTIIITGQNVLYQMRSALLKKLKDLDTSYFDQHAAGAISSIIVSDTDSAGTVFSGGIISMVADACSLIGILVVIFVKSKGLFLLVICVLPLVVMSTGKVQKRMLESQKENRQAVSESAAILPETGKTYETVYAYEAQPYMERRFDRTIEKGYAALRHVSFYDAVYSPVIVTVSSILTGVMMCLIAGFTGMSDLFGVSAGTGVALMTYITKIFDPIESLGKEIQSIQEAQAAFSRLNDFMSLPEKNHSDAGAVYCTHQIEIRHISFGYTADHPVFQNFSLTVDEGSHIVVTGRTGSGKSTLFALIQGLYEPQAGQILIAGRNPYALSEIQRRELFGVVEQKTALIEGNLRVQLTIHRPGIQDETLISALHTVGLYDWYTGLSDGLDTGRDRLKLSDGQLQLLSIARAIVCNPRILLMDEMNASIDAATEQMVNHALQKAAQGRTVISIAHRRNVFHNELVIDLQSIAQTNGFPYNLTEMR